METNTQIGRLNKGQLEILKLFSRDLNDTEIKEIKKLIVNYLAKNLTDLADEKWKENKWTDNDMDRFLDSHQRTPYNSKE